MKNFFFIFCLFIAQLPFAQNLSQVESVEYDAVSGRFLASNGNSIVEVDGDGNEVAFFGTTAQAEYGMEIMNGTLFVIDNNRVKAYNLGDGSQLMNFQIPGASFLNGMASDGESRLWVTDFSLKKIHEVNVADLNSPSQTVIVANTVSTPNGIVFDGLNNRLLFVNWGSNASIKAVDLSDNSVTTVTATNLGNCDGIDSDAYGNYYVSSWSPTRITKFNSDFSVSQIITAPGISSPADICYAQSIDTLAIPNSGNSTITYIGFSAPIFVAETEDSFGLSCYPNPLSDKSVVEFSLPQEGEVDITFIDINGRLIHQLIHEKLSSGRHQILLSGLNLPSGNYFCRFNWNGVEEVIPVVK